MMKLTTRPVRIASVEVLSGLSVRLGLTDGTTKTIDLERYLHGPIFEPVRNNRAVFASVRVDPEAGTIVWPNGVDIDPDVLCQNRKPDEASTTAGLK